MKANFTDFEDSSKLEFLTYMFHKNTDFQEISDLLLYFSSSILSFQE